MTRVFVVDTTYLNEFYSVHDAQSCGFPKR